MKAILAKTKRLISYFLRIHARIRLKATQKIFPDQNLIAFSKALNDVLDNNLNEEEHGWITKIEDQRRHYLSTNKVIEVLDFGAGKADSNRTEEAMYGGISTEVSVNNICLASKPYFWSLLLFKLVRHFKPKLCVELGTCLGISASYQSAALTLNSFGKLITIEGSPSLSKISAQTFSDLGLEKVDVLTGRFEDQLHQVLTNNEVVDFVFIDGHHDKDATIHYFERFLPFLKSDAVIVFDDIN